MAEVWRAYCAEFAFLQAGRRMRFLLELGDVAHGRHRVTIHMDRTDGT